MPVSEGRTALYRFYDATDALLYIGISQDAENRWREHMLDKPWAKKVAMRVVEWYETRALAEAAETREIRAWRPRHNKQSAGTTPLRNIRVPDEVWKPALDNARHEGTDLTKVIVAYLRQYNRRHERAALKSEPAGES